MWTWVNWWKGGVTWPSNEVGADRDGLGCPPSAPNEPSRTNSTPSASIVQQCPIFNVGQQRRRSPPCSASYGTCPSLLPRCDASRSAVSQIQAQLGPLCCHQPVRDRWRAARDRGAGPMSIYGGYRASTKYTVERCGRPSKANAWGQRVRSSAPDAAISKCGVKADCPQSCFLLGMMLSGTAGPIGPYACRIRFAVRCAW